MIKTDLGKTIISFFGPPGSGKGTLAERLVKEQDYKMLSTGNLCRQHIAQKTEFGQMLNDFIKKGDLVPDELITDMVKDWLKLQVGQNKPIILDGYPRTKRQAELFYNVLKNEFPEYLYRVILINLPEETIVKRLAGRLVCENKKCQAVYNVSMLTEKDIEECEKCGGKLIRRDDDKEEVVRARLKNYVDYSTEILNYYESVGQRIECLNIDNLTIDEVFEKFESVL
ncbi:MAG: nucleoside monophosphate kinase [bacterium]